MTHLIEGDHLVCAVLHGGGPGARVPVAGDPEAAFAVRGAVVHQGLALGVKLSKDCLPLYRDLRPRRSL